ncbi:MAG: hypothetical protein V4648_08410 [Bacteroidota bacterium]
MKITNTTKVYIYTGLLFVFTFLLASKLIKAYNTNEFDYLKIGINSVAVISLVYLIIKYANIENNKNE